MRDRNKSMHLCSRILSGEKVVSISELGKLVNLFIHTVSHYSQTFKGLSVKPEAKKTLQKTRTNLLAMGFGNDFWDKIPKV